MGIGLRIAKRRVGPTRPMSRPDSAPIEARRADNVVWRRHWLDDGRLVVDFLSLAAVEVDEASDVGDSFRTRWPSP